MSFTQPIKSPVVQAKFIEEEKTMMINQATQHRVKHFDLLLSRELSLIQRQYEQHLITHEKFERSIRHQKEEKKISLPLTSIYNEATNTIDYKKLRQKVTKHDPNAIHRSSIDLSSLLNTSTDVSSDETPVKKPRKSRRLCTKAHPLPPIIKANVPHPRHLPAEKDIHWISQIQSLNKEKESRLTYSTDSTVDEHLHSFLETLPAPQEIHYGFDSFGSSALYSTRAPVAMR